MHPFVMQTVMFNCPTCVDLAVVVAHVPGILRARRLYPDSPHEIIRTMCYIETSTPEKVMQMLETIEGVSNIALAPFRRHV